MSTNEYPHTMQELDSVPWAETTAEDYQFALEVLPPEKWIGDAFAVGEPYCHIDEPFAVVWRVYTITDGRYFKRLDILRRIDPSDYDSQIRAQFGGISK